jgi:2,4-dienoyl-CoA reductase-like NADH-dependent reductase (Old Yellow Enzyme family)
MGMEDPIPTFSYLISTIKRLYPDLLYLHLIEPNIAGSGDPEASRGIESNQVFYDLWAPKPLIAAGGFTKETAIKAADEDRLVAFGRYYIANVRLIRSYRSQIVILSGSDLNIAGLTVTIAIKPSLDSLQPRHLLHWRGSWI